jgi:hypothetical protein
MLSLNGRFGSPHWQFREQETPSCVLEASWDPSIQSHYIRFDVLTGIQCRILVGLKHSQLPTEAGCFRDRTDREPLEDVFWKSKPSCSRSYPQADVLSLVVAKLNCALRLASCVFAY